MASFSFLQKKKDLLINLTVIYFLVYRIQKRWQLNEGTGWRLCFLFWLHSQSHEQVLKYCGLSQQSSFYIYPTEVEGEVLYTILVAKCRVMGYDSHTSYILMGSRRTLDKLLQEAWINNELVTKLWEIHTEHRGQRWSKGQCKLKNGSKENQC